MTGFLKKGGAPRQNKKWGLAESWFRGSWGAGVVRAGFLGLGAMDWVLGASGAEVVGWVGPGLLALVCGLGSICSSVLFYYLYLLT